MKIYSFCITFMPTAYATIDTTIIHHVYETDFAVCIPFCPGRKLGPVGHQIGGCVFFQVNGLHVQIECFAI